MQDREFKLQHIANFDGRHRDHPLPVILNETDMRITTDRAHPTPGVL